MADYVLSFEPTADGTEVRWVMTGCSTLAPSSVAFSMIVSSLAATVTRFVAEGKARLQEMLVVTFGRTPEDPLDMWVGENVVVIDVAMTETSEAPIA